MKILHVILSFLFMCINSVYFKDANAMTWHILLEINLVAMVKTNINTFRQGEIAKRRG